MDTNVGIGIISCIVYVVLLNIVYKREYKGYENHKENKRDI
jgi:hypothetical protein